MSSDSSSGAEPDWLRETLQSRVQHARRDVSEETLMRLAQDPLLLNAYLRREGAHDVGLASLQAGHRAVLALPGLAGSRGDSTQHKLANYVQTGTTPGTSFQPEPFVAGEDDRHLALELGEAESGSPRPGFLGAWAHQAVAGGAIILIVLLVLAAAL
jgi:hypothetical protein